MSKLLACACLVLALAAGASAHCGKTLVLTEKFVEEDNIGSFAPGGTYLFNNELYEGDMLVGTTAGTCTVKSADENGTIQFCVTDLTVDGYGTISNQGMFIDVLSATPFKLSITGGTGKYKGLSGVATTTADVVGKQWTYTVVFTTKPPCSDAER